MQIVFMHLESHFGVNGWSTAAKPLSTLWAEGEGANRKAENGGERYERSEAKGSHSRSSLDRVDWWLTDFQGLLMLKQLNKRDAIRPGAHPKWKSWAPLTCERKQFCGMRRRTVKAGWKGTITMLTLKLAIKHQLLTPKMSKNETTRSSDIFRSTVISRIFVTRYGRTPLDGKKRLFSRSVPCHCPCWQHRLWQIWSCHGPLTWWSIVFWMVTLLLSQIRMIGVLGVQVDVVELGRNSWWFRCVKSLNYYIGLWFCWRECISERVQGPTTDAALVPGFIHSFSLAGIRTFTKWVVSILRTTWHLHHIIYWYRFMSK